jgi:excisionase family DNA binding protein
MLNASERLIHERARSGGLQVRLLRPGLPRIAIFDLTDWIERQKRRTRWLPLAPQPKASGIGVIAYKVPVGSQDSPAAAYLTLSDVAETLSVAYETVRTMIRDNGLPVIMMATRAPRVDPTELDLWLRTRPIRAARCPNPARRGSRVGARLRQSAFADLEGGGWSETAESESGMSFLRQKP